MPPGRRVAFDVVCDVTLRGRGLVTLVPFRDNGWSGIVVEIKGNRVIRGSCGLIIVLVTRVSGYDQNTIKIWRRTARLLFDCEVEFQIWRVLRGEETGDRDRFRFGEIYARC